MIDQKLYRDVLGQFATGVTVVTTYDSDKDICGLTINAFSAVSIEPSLVMVCPQKSSISHQEILKNGLFCIHFLHESQEDTAWAFAKKELDTSQVKWSAGENGSPVLNDYIAKIECKVWNNYDGGDHDILIGEILAMDIKETNKAPLVFHQGKMKPLV